MWQKRCENIGRYSQPFTAWMKNYDFDQCIALSRKRYKIATITRRIGTHRLTELAPAMTALFNQSLQTGQLPQEWKLANVSPIYKKEDKHIAANYRPISLTYVCSKLLEHIVVSHLLRHNDKHSILTPLQHGFRQKYSTVVNYYSL